ncbi:Hypothetical predicted protein [Olea europaea subsp. europaea]|nr:Hypothetical predicted protein [Olea europaea subsp. europaea]
MYRPLRALNGIPGAKSLVVCLTGYQRQDRDDIMTMVGLMGANFSKPLIANKVTHLICYKFEGDKYELAKKMKKIKIVNHRWLENCLKAWEILPEADYDRSGYELEMMEAEARDSEEETEDVAAKNDVKRKSIANPQNTQAKLKNPHQSLMQEVSKNNSDSFTSNCSTNVGNINEDLSNDGKESKFDNVEPAGNFLQEIPNCHLEMLASCNNECPGKILSSLPSNTFDDKMIFEKADNDTASMSKSAKRSPHSSTSKSTGKSYSRRSLRKSRLPLCSERIDSNAENPSTANKLGCDINISSLVEEQVDAGFDGMGTPSSGTMLHLDKGENSLLQDKRKMTISYGSSKSLKTSHDSETISEGKSVVKRTDRSLSGPLINGSCRMDNHVSPENNTSYMGESMELNFTDNVTKVVTSVTRQECSDVAHLSSLHGLECRSLTSDLEAKDKALSKTEHPIAQIVVQQRNLQNIDAPSPGTKISEVKKSSDQAQLELLKRGDSAPKSKTLGRRKLSKKTLGSRTCLSKGNATKPNDFIESPKTLLQNDAVIRSIEEIEMEEYEKFGNSKKLEISPPTSSVRIGQETEMNNLGISGNETTNKDGSMDDETEDTKDKEEYKFDVALDKEKSAEIESQLENMCTDKRVGVNDSSKQTDGSIIGAMAKAENIRKEDKGIEAEMAVSSKENENSESNLVKHGGEKNLTRGKKRPLNKTKRTVATDVGNLNEIGRKDGCNNKSIKEKTTAQNEKTSPSAGKTKACQSKKSNLTEVEKENNHFVMGGQNISNDKNFVGKVMPKSSKNPLKDSKSANADMDLARVEQIPKVKTEPIWFILSGHKLQRKEFQQVIKCLNGRLCRDSHKWSYQATHFIVPDPVRRTEKFFAAAASGSWILKTDYLTASNEAGRFLLEEPYEWHKKCLTEDGAINLEAPRKWRLVKERTGHGAFYGMRIIIYGECIAPPLETLKRVIKAGDGTILATSPPYTRFLQSSVDFAIVSPGMPRVDMWIQEFLSHEIPCVLADYLVEYVCKPGYSLERHVQYNTHVWAEKSFNNLVNRMEKVVEDTRKPQH